VRGSLRAESAHRLRILRTVALVVGALALTVAFALSPAACGSDGSVSVAPGAVTSGFQQAIDVCPEGGTVDIAEGRYTITSPLRLKSGVTFKGAGVGRTVLTMPAQS